MKMPRMYIDENASDVFRLGKKTTGKNRALKIVLTNNQQIKDILVNAKFIKTKVEQKYKQVVIAKDRTACQREEWKEQRKSKASKDTKINQHKDEGTDGEVRHETNISHVSPIPNNRKSYHSNIESPQIAIPSSQSGSEPYMYLSTTVSDETVVGGIPSNDDTIVGGIPSQPPMSPVHVENVINNGQNEVVMQPNSPDLYRE